ncbi:MAG: phenylalanine--tRNA ligase subunit beta [Planctomycetota bacterium]
MRTSVTWINDYLDRPATAEEQAELLTAAGLNFDGGDDADNGERWQEIETTSNRGDCLSHVGMAREICAMSGRRLKAPAAAPRASGEPASRHVAVSNDDHEACPRYTARVIRGVTVGPSPEWLQRRLRAIGQVPRNNLVDCTNFVLFELGQPTHVFDLDTLRGARIHVRRARKGERFLPIGEAAQETELAGGELVIADGERPVAIAGVKGGAVTAVTDRTVNVLVEAATFHPAAVRAASRGLRIASDSSYRFERGVHPSEIDAAADRLVQLILETAGGTLCEGTVEAGAPLPAPRKVAVRPSRVRAILGTDIPLEEVVRALDTLGFSPVVRGDAIDCSVPARRIDIEREIDLIEEVCRIHGLDRIPMKETLAVRVAPVEPEVSAPRAVKGLLVGLGFVESITHTLVSERHAAPFFRAGRAALRVGDERAGGTPVLRPSVIPSLLEVRRRNADAGLAELRLFEFASAFALQAGGAHDERALVTLLADAPADPDGAMRWMRGACERMLRLLAGNHASIRAEAVPAAERAPWYSAEARVTVDGNPLGGWGLLAPQALAPFGLAGTFAAAELSLRPLYANYPPDARAEKLPDFPGIERDLSAILPEQATWAEVEALVHGLRLPCFESLGFVGTYRGKQTGAGRKSVTMRLVFRAGDRTLRREDADQWMASVADALRGRMGAEIRS